MIYPDDAHRRHAEELLAGPYNPVRRENMEEALQSVEIDDLMSSAFTKREYGVFGAAIIGQIRGYWSAKASIEADRRIANAQCPDCLDTGCPKCTPWEGPDA